MKRVVTAQEMRDFEREWFADGRADSLEWMERAAEGLDALLQERYAKQPVLCVCGGGNNGGDGFALLRLLTGRGAACAGVLLSDAGQLSGDAKTNYQRALECGVRFYHELTNELIQEYGVIVDAMFGTGLSRPLTGAYEEAVRRINDSGKRVVSADIPSGVDATSGSILGCAVNANETVTFEFYKRGHLLFPGRASCGEVILQPLSEEAAGESPRVALLEREDIERLLPRRPLDSHKGSNGRALMCVGSGRYTGAALLSAGAALRAGAGLTTVAVPGAVKPAFTALPEAIAEAVSDGPDWDKAACGRAAELLPGKNAVCVGCGAGRGDILPLIETVLRSGLPAVLDADALNQIAKRRELFKLFHPNVILTPHPAEMGRLCGMEADAIVADPLETANRYAKEWNCVVLLKGATTCVADGKIVRLNTSGNPGLAKGGSGDVLSGLITGLLAQGLNAFDAACCGSYLLGASADMALTLLKERMLLAGDVVDAIERTIGSDW